MVTTLRLQLSNSGAFSEPNNGVEFDLLDWQSSKDARIQTVDIPSSDGGIVQHLGTRVQTFRATALGLGDIDTRNTKEDGLGNIQWHTSSASWQGNPASLSILIDGTATISEKVFLSNWRLSSRRARAEIHDVSLQLVDAGN